MRVREMVGLTAIHTLFNREHNRICDELQNHSTVTWDNNNGNPWTDDDFFYNARRIMTATWQKIVYEDWLPLIIGDDTYTWLAGGQLNLRAQQFQNTFYHHNISPQIENSFSGAAFRQDIVIFAHLSKML